MSRRIVDDKQRRDRLGWRRTQVPQSPCALWVPVDLGPLAAQPRGHLRRWRSSTIYPDIACVATSCICPRGARNAMPPNSRIGS
jgi:hypothetical protein